MATRAAGQMVHAMLKGHHLQRRRSGVSGTSAGAAFRGGGAARFCDSRWRALVDLSAAAGAEHGVHHFHGPAGRNADLLPIPHLPVCRFQE